MHYDTLKTNIVFTINYEEQMCIRDNYVYRQIKSDVLTAQIAHYTSIAITHQSWMGDI